MISEANLHVESLLSLPEKQRAKFLASLSDDEAAWLYYDWRFWARAEQLPPPGEWATWSVIAGRGYGKTRTGGAWTNENAKQAGIRQALVAMTPGDARAVMVEGESGIIAYSEPGFVPTYEPSKRLLTWPNGSIAHTYSAENPDQLRGPQHHKAWVDEFAKFRYARDTWDNLALGMRLGESPQVLITTTPRPIPVLKEILADPSTVITRGSTYDNAGNLPKRFLEQIKRRYEGTRLGRQEIEGALISDAEGALWTHERLDRLRVGGDPQSADFRPVPTLVRVVVAIDPAVTANEESDETGMVIAGLGEDGHGYIWADLSGRYSPAEWGEKAVTHYVAAKANVIVGEVNNGGDMVEYTVQTSAQHLKVHGVAFEKVHASRGKYTRAEPVSALYEQGRVHHVGCFPELEDEMCSWTPGKPSPSRMDALVWAITWLMVEQEVFEGVEFSGGGRHDGSYWRH